VAGSKSWAFVPILSARQPPVIETLPSASNAAASPPAPGVPASLNVPVADRRVPRLQSYMGSRTRSSGLCHPPAEWPSGGPEG
jgi:hypothetical protein